MTNQKKTAIKQYLTTVIAGLAIAAVVISFQLGQFGTSMRGIARSVSDGCFVAGCALAGLGLMTLIANAGNFYGLSYLMKRLVSQFRFREQDAKMKMTYYEYVQSQEQKEKKSVKFILIVGVVYLAIALIFVFIFEQC